jgi:hypothetical protein
MHITLLCFYMRCFGRNEVYSLTGKGSPRSYKQQHVWRENPSLLGCYTVSSWICRPFEGYQYIYLHLHGPKDISVGTDIVRYVCNRF